ncbi:hypothetical protein GCM10012275_43210 [Longimycelium tulufanense]|uniref:SseB protein N-terminal domain-containing protein n=1 Tax=Longimycelium tulufanense TaxID=907463 RepID=A0A8J3CFI5_9PSEU|nr:hypothetical protein GCM10012275_43210 [Longimycelium tulufanense]
MSAGQEPAVVAAVRQWRAAQTEAVAPAERERLAEAMLAAIRVATLYLPMVRDTDDGQLAPGRRETGGVAWLVAYSTVERLAGAERQLDAVWQVRGVDVLGRYLVEAPELAGAVLDLGSPHFVFFPRLEGIVAPEAVLHTGDSFPLDSSEGAW